MATYLTVHKACSSYTGLDGFTDQRVRLDNAEEVTQAHKLCENEKNLAGFFKATVVPIRTDCDSLPQDLFFPALISGVIKTQSASNVAFIFIAFVWDLATLPIRLITLVPRIWYNSLIEPSEHPLVPFLRAKGLDLFLDTENEVDALATEVDATIRIFTEDRVGENMELKGKRYRLHLGDREVPFFSFPFECDFSSRYPAAEHTHA